MKYIGATVIILPLILYVYLIFIKKERIRRKMITFLILCILAGAVLMMGDRITEIDIFKGKIKGEAKVSKLDTKPVKDTDEYSKFSWNVSSLSKGDSIEYVRTITIRNNSDLAIHNFHFSIRCDKPIVKASQFPFVEGGFFVINYDRTVDNTYEAEIGLLPSHKSVIVALGANKPFEVENVKIYNK